MLVLKRKVGERILIGKDIWITLVTADRGQAKIGIEAPDSVDISREELLPLDGQYKEKPDAPDMPM